ASAGPLTQTRSLPVDARRPRLTTRHWLRDGLRPLFTEPVRHEPGRLPETTSTRAPSPEHWLEPCWSHTDERPCGSPDSHGRRTRTHPRSRTDTNGRGYPYGSLRIKRLGIRIMIRRCGLRPGRRRRG